MADCVDCDEKLGFLRRGRCPACEATHQQALADEAKRQIAELSKFEAMLEPHLTSAESQIASWPTIGDLSAPEVPHDRLVGVLQSALQSYVDSLLAPDAAWWQYPITVATLLEIELALANSLEPFDLDAVKESAAIGCVRAGWPSLAQCILGPEIPTLALSSGEVVLACEPATLEKYSKETETRIEFAGMGKEMNDISVSGGSGRLHDVTVREGWDRIDEGQIIVTNKRIHFESDSNRSSFPIESLGATTAPRAEILCPGPGFWEDGRIQSSYAELLSGLITSAHDAAVGRVMRVDESIPLPTVPKMRAELESKCVSDASETDHEVRRFATWFNFTEPDTSNGPVSPSATPTIDLVCGGSNPFVRGAGFEVEHRSAAETNGPEDLSPLSSSDEVALPATAGDENFGGDSPLRIEVQVVGRVEPGVDEPLGSWFMIVVFRCTNVTKEPIELRPLELSMHEADETRFEPVESEVLAKLGLQPPPRPKIAPRLAGETFAVYELPKDAVIRFGSYRPFLTREQYMFPVEASFETIPADKVFRPEKRASESHEDPRLRMRQAINTQVVRELHAHLGQDPSAWSEELPAGERRPSEEMSHVSSQAGHEDSADDFLLGGDERIVEVGELLAHFGMKRLTEQARNRLADRLAGADLSCDPPTSELERYSTARVFRVSRN